MQAFFINRVSKLRQFVLAFLIVSLAATLCFFLSSTTGYRVVALILLVTVSLIAMFFDIFPVLFSAILSALIWDYFFIPPRFTFQVASAEDSLMLLMYLIIALVNAVLTYKIRQVEKEVRRKEEKANAVKLYNVLLNSLSHELKTPITTILGATDNLSGGANKISEENKLNLVNEISIAAVRLNQQVENLLNMSRIEAGFIQPKKDWCDVNELIYSVVNRLEDKWKEHQLKIKVNEKLPLFKLDMGLMEHALHNIIGNAIIYTPPQSIIRIEADITVEVKGHFSEDLLENKRDNVSNNLVLVIADNGKGFPEEEINYVFDKFYRLTNSKTGGTGLGLSIARGFVEAHGGKIELANVPAGGAKFIITIPAETSFLKQTEK